MPNTVATDTGTWAIVELADVVKHFDQARPVGLFRKETERVTALDGVSLAIEPGSFVAYAGPNGAGKSTTFKLLAGMLVPQSGQVRVFGLDPFKRRVDIMKKTGVLFGNRNELWSDHPVRASFAWKKAVWEIPDAAYRRAFDRLVGLMRIEPFLDTFARELSLGQRMRANLALTMLHEPELVLLDEPTLGLDVLAKRDMIDFLKAVNRDEGVTVVVTSHDMDDLSDMAGRLILINRGRIAFDGPFDALSRRAGDQRILTLTCEGPPAEIPRATWVSSERDRHTYRYEAGDVRAVLTSVAGTPGIADVETGRPPIESVIARLYEGWQT